MTHELKEIFIALQEAKAKKVPAVLATVVALDGSSYRRPGVRMLITAAGKRIGAVSGGCVEKEIQRQAAEVFNTHQPKMMTYDGRFRLGCEGVLYILLEPITQEEELQEQFWQAVASRDPFAIKTYYKLQEGLDPSLGSVFHINGKKYPLGAQVAVAGDYLTFEQEFLPANHLYILGAEHDSVALCQTASAMGWEVSVVTSPEEEKSLSDFPGAKSLLPLLPEQVAHERMDTNTAVVVMSHNFARDVAYVLALQRCSATYIGILGPASRREQLLNAIMDRDPEFNGEFVEKIYGPAGIDIGAETAQEIAISVMSEILSVFRGAKVAPLKDKKGRIHS